MSYVEQAQTVQPEGTTLAAQWLDDMSALVSLPDVCVRIFDILHSPNASAQSLGQVVAQDPSLTARLLRLVNSSFYGFSRRVDTVSRAIAIIGDRELYNLVLAVTAVRSFKGVPSVLVNMDTFWRHSIYCGLIARNIGKRCKVLHPERLSVTGLLHDIGSLILYRQVPELAGDLLMIAQGDEKLLCHAEEQAFEFSHAELGAMLLDRWLLPKPLVEAVRYHHDPAGASERALETAILHMADLLANRSEIGSLFEEPSPDAEMNPCVWETTGLSPGDLDHEEVIGEAGLQFAETASLLAVG